MSSGTWLFSHFHSFSEPDQEYTVVELSIVLIVHFFEHVVNGWFEDGTLHGVFSRTCNHLEYMISAIA